MKKCRLEFQYFLYETEVKDGFYYYPFDYANKEYIKSNKFKLLCYICKN